MTVVELIRNAGGEARDDWPAPDSQRPLDRTGRAVASALVQALGEHAVPVSYIASSPAVRCRQTVEPLAAALGLAVAAEDRLSDAADVPVSDSGDAWVAAAWTGGRVLGLLDEIVAARPQGRAVLCTHADVVPATMALLAGRDGLVVGDVRLPKGGRFTLEFDGERCIAAVPAAPAKPHR